MQSPPVTVSVRANAFASRAGRSIAASGGRPLTPSASGVSVSRTRESIAMSKVSTRHTSYHASGGERVFADDKGRLWSAAHAGEVIIFTCISDGRNSGRAIVVNLAKLDRSVGDETLRAWLEAAPRIGTLP